MTTVWTLGILQVLVTVAFLLWWFKKSKAKKKVKSLEMEKPLSISVEAGWVSVNTKELLSMASTREAIHLLRDTEKEWEGQCGLEWFKPLHYRSKAACVSLALNAYATLQDEELLRVKQSVSTSALLFDYEVPVSLWVFDQVVALNMMKYLILTTPVEVVIEDMELQPYLPISNLEKQINEAINLVPVAVALYQKIRVPSLLTMHTEVLQLQKLLQVEKEKRLSPLQLQKILSCIYITAGLSIPRDYIYIDIEVSDYVLKSGVFEVVDKKERTHSS